MRHVLRVLLVSVALSMAVDTHGQSPCVFPRADQVHPAVSAIVSNANGRFSYSYQVTVLSDSPNALSQFAVAASPTDNTASLATPETWRSLIAPIGYYTWVARNQRQGLAPGGSVNLGVTAAEPPTVVTFLARNYIERPRFPEGQAPENCENSKVVDNSFKGSTVGPKAPPSTDRIQLVNYLISLVHDARRLNWIKRDGAQQSLLAKLITAKRNLEQGDVATAKSNLSSFVNEVEATSCDDFSCHGNKPSTSEAYALLKFNAEYLIGQIP